MMKIIDRILDNKLGAFAVFWGGIVVIIMIQRMAMPKAFTKAEEKILYERIDKYCSNIFPLHLQSNSKHFNDCVESYFEYLQNKKRKEIAESVVEYDY